MVIFFIVCSSTQYVNRQEHKDGQNTQNRVILNRRRPNKELVPIRGAASVAWTWSDTNLFYQLRNTEPQNYSQVLKTADSDVARGLCETPYGKESWR